MWEFLGGTSMKSSKTQCDRSRFTALTSVVHLLITVSLLSLPSQSTALRATGYDRVSEAAGDLDTSFGVGGKVTTDFFSDIDVADALAIQVDGKIVAAGVAVKNSSDADFALARYNADGSLDATFSSAGKVTTDFFGKLDQAF